MAQGLIGEISGSTSLSGGPIDQMSDFRTGGVNFYQESPSFFKVENIAIIGGVVLGILWLKMKVKK